MELSSQQISNNYLLCYNYISEQLADKIYPGDDKLYPDNPDLIDLTQSVIGHENVVKLLQKFPFTQSKYQSTVELAIDEVRKSLFPDVCKNRFFSIDDEKYRFLENFVIPENDQPVLEDTDKSLDSIYDLLSKELWDYFVNKLLVNHPQILNTVIRFPKTQGQIPGFKEELNRKVYLFKKFYPEGNICFDQSIDCDKSLSKKQIIENYLKVYLGVEKFFPKNFLQTNAIKRSAIMVKFLVEEILESRPKKILDKKDETLFIKHKLQNVYRYFNYSFNRVLGNAYPEVIHPWLKSRTSPKFWKNKQNRINAVKWLVEDKLGFLPDNLYKAKIKRTDFSKNGLSFLFNRFYNSVSSALEEAYPEKNPWELGNVPFAFWTNENSAKAIRWLFRVRGWNSNELPFRYKTRELNRKIFSEYGLATLFEKKFNCNIFSAVSLAFPAKFHPWEFGNVPLQYWENQQNIFKASKWIAKSEGINEENIVNSIREGELTFSDIEKYRIGQALKRKSKGNLEKIYGLWFWKDHSAFLDEKRILRKIKNQNKRFLKSSVIRTLLYGLFGNEVIRNHQMQQRAYRRISYRISTQEFT